MDVIHHVNENQEVRVVLRYQHIHHGIQYQASHRHTTERLGYQIILQHTTRLLPALIVDSFVPPTIHEMDLYVKRYLHVETEN